MKKKGFTLVELLAVILIIGLIFTFAMKNILKYSNNLKQISQEEQKEIILSSAKSYFLERESLKQQVRMGLIIDIKYSELKNKNYLPDKLKNFKSNKPLAAENYMVCVRYNNYRYEYKLSETDVDGACETIFN